MRQIKFRQFVDNTFHYWGFNDDGIFDGPLNTYVKYRSDQFTGLKDKNGKEIYELHQINNRFRVIYTPCKYVLQDISTNDIFDFNEKDTYEITREYEPI